MHGEGYDFALPALVLVDPLAAALGGLAGGAPAAAATVTAFKGGPAAARSRTRTRTCTVPMHRSRTHAHVHAHMHRMHACMRTSRMTVFRSGWPAPRTCIVYACMHACTCTRGCAQGPVREAATKEASSHAPTPQAAWWPVPNIPCMHLHARARTHTHTHARAHIGCDMTHARLRPHPDGDRVASCPPSLARACMHAHTAAARLTPTPQAPASVHTNHACMHSTGDLTNLVVI
jgi:hypothetical protein